MNNKQSMNILIGADIDPKFKRAFQTADKEFKELGETLVDLRKKKKLVNKFEMNTDAVEKARGRLAFAQKAVMKLRREMNKNPSKKLSAEFEAAKNKSDQLSKALIKQRDNLRLVSTEMNKAKINTSKYREENGKLSRGIDQAKNRQQKLARLTSKKREIGQGFSKQRNRAMVAAGMGYAGNYFMNEGEEFQHQASKLQAVSGMSGAERSMLEIQARNQAVRTKFKPGEVVSGQAYFAKSGFKANDIKSATPGMLDLATAADMGIAESADISSNVLSSFKIKKESMGKVADILTATFTGSNVDLGMMGETMKYAGSIAGQFAKSDKDKIRILKETSLMTGLMGNVGVQASMAGTSMRSAYTRLSSPSSEAAKALGSINVKNTYSASDVKKMKAKGIDVNQGDMLPIIDILESINEGLKGKGSGDRMGIITDIFGKNAVSGMSEVLTAFDKKDADFVKLYSKIENNDGLARKTASTMMENYRGSKTRMASAFSDFKVSIFEKFEKPMRRMFDATGKFLLETSKWVNDNPKTVSALGSAAAAMALISGAGLIIGVAKLTAKWVGLNSVMGLMKITPLAIGLKSLFKGTKNLGKGALFLSGKALPAVMTAMRVLTVGLMANPIGLAVTAIAGGAYLIYKNWDKLGKWWNSWTFKDVGEGVGTMLFDTAYSIQNKYGALKDWMSSLTWKDIGTNVGKSLLKIPLMVMSAFTDLKKWLTDFKLPDIDFKLPDFGKKWSNFKEGFSAGVDRSGMKQRIMEKNPKGINPFAENAKSRDIYFANLGENKAFDNQFGKKASNDIGFSRKTAGAMLAGSLAVANPQMVAAKPQIEARPIASASSKIVTDNSDRSVHLTIHQLPGEDSEKFANRVADLVDKKKNQRSSGALYDEAEW